MFSYRKYLCMYWSVSQKRVPMGKESLSTHNSPIDKTAQNVGMQKPKNAWTKSSLHTIILTYFSCVVVVGCGCSTNNKLRSVNDKMSNSSKGVARLHYYCQSQRQS